jgi:hypothetical protein
MWSRPSMFVLAMIAALANAGLASTSASAFADGSVRFSHRDNRIFAQRLDPYKNLTFGASVATAQLVGRRRHYPSNFAQ